MIEARNLYKLYGETRALRGVSLAVPEGQIMALLGPNGSGKTTLIKVLALLTRANSGEATICGKNAGEDPTFVRRSIGVVTHQTMLYGELTAQENLRFYARLYGVANATERVEQALSQVGMMRYGQQRVGTMSHGMAKRVAIARAILHEPRVLLLDEPEAGLDEESLGMLKGIIQSADAEASPRTVLMATHNISMGLELAHTVAVIAAGRIVYQGAPRSLDEVALRDAYPQLAGAVR